MRNFVVIFVFFIFLGCATTGHRESQSESKVEMTYQVIDNQTIEVRIVTFERFQDNGVRLTHPEPIKSLVVRPSSQAGLMLRSGNYKISFYQEGNSTPVMEVPSMISGKKTTLHISPTG